MNDSASADVDVLADTVAQTHAVLHARMRSAEACRPTAGTPRAALSAADPFLASTSRHVSAANAVLAPAARRHLDHGHRRAHELALQSRRLEIALSQVKAKLYGSTFAVRRPWFSIWEEVERELAATRTLELRLVGDLARTTSPAQRDDLAERLYRTERRVPTRPHPYLPHRACPGDWPAASRCASTGSGTPRRAGWCPTRCVRGARGRAGSPSICWPTRLCPAEDAAGGTTARARGRALHQSVTSEPGEDRHAANVTAATAPRGASGSNAPSSPPRPGRPPASRRSPRSTVGSHRRR